MFRNIELFNFKNFIYVSYRCDINYIQNREILRYILINIDYFNVYIGLYIYMYYIYL